MIRIGRAEARALGAVRYFTGERCRRGHESERYVSTGACIECQMLRNAGMLGPLPCTAQARSRRTGSKRDYTNLTPAQIEEWYASVRAIRANRYRHRPLEELPIIYQPKRIAEVA